jgi:hypothetical protein
MSRCRLCILSATATLLLAASSDGVRAQALSKVRIGDDVAALARIAARPSKTETIGHVTMRSWELPNGNALSATASEGDRVVYLEADWGGRLDGAPTDFPDLRFGTTTLQELRAKFRSNGMAFSRRPPTVRTTGGVALLNSYEVGAVIVTFVTTVADAEIAGAKDLEASLASHARLDAISLASPSFAAQEWGEAIYSSGYKKIEWR